MLDPFQDELTIVVMFREAVRRAMVEDQIKGARKCLEFIEKNTYVLERAVKRTLKTPTLDCPMCGTSGGAPVHPEQPCCECGRTCFDTE